MKPPMSDKETIESAWKDIVEIKEDVRRGIEELLAVDENWLSDQDRITYRENLEKLLTINKLFSNEVMGEIGAEVEKKGRPLTPHEQECLLKRITVPVSVPWSHTEMEC